MVINKNFLLILLFIVLLSSIRGQFSNVRFDRLSVKQGLSQSTVTSIVRDSLGFMWFGTYEGLNRYDGYDFKVYKVEDKPSNGLSDNFISCLLIDSKGILWVGTANGLNVYDQKKDKFSFYKHDKNNNNSLSGSYISSIYEDKKGTIWIGTFDSGLNRFNEKDSSFTRFVKDENNPNTISDNLIESIYEDKKGNLWIGTRGGGLNKFDRDNNKFVHYKHNEKNSNSISGNSVTRIIEDNKGNLILAIWEKGIDFFNVEKEIFIHKQFDYGLYDIKLYNNNILLAGTRNNGFIIYYINDDKVEVYKNDDGGTKSLSSNSIYDIFIDNIGTIWLGTSGGGINNFNPKFNNFKVFQNNPKNKNSLSNNYILSIIEDKNNYIWVGTRGGGLNRYDPFNNKWTFYKHDPKNPNSISNDIISSLYEDSKGNIWIGTETGGLNKFIPKTESFKAYKYDGKNANSISSNWVTDIHEDKDGIFWLATLTGELNKFDPVKELFVAYMPDNSNPQSISGEALTKLFEDNENNIWIGTFGYGLNKFKKKDQTFTSYRHIENDTTSISIDLVLVPYKSKAGTVWVGTTFGLNRLNDDGTFSNITVYNGLPSNGVYGILEDDSGFLWMSTNKGLAKYNPVDKSIKVYNGGDGLPGDELNFGPEFKAQDGKMFFGCPYGFFYFHPDSLKSNDFLPPVVFTSFTILNKPALVDQNISTLDYVTLNYDDKIFSFTFAALNYIQSSQNEFAYKLEGFNDDWIYIGTERKVTFTNLDPGEYVLKVKAANNDGYWNNTPKELIINILPPFWLSWWFKLIGVLIFILIGPAFYYRRVKALKLEQKRQHEFSGKLISSQENERSRIAQELHDSLGQELLLIKNRAMLGINYIKEDLRAKQQLEFIADYAGNAIKQVRQISHNLRPPELDRLGLTETLITMFTEIENSGAIKVRKNIENIDGMIKKENEINLLRIMQEAVSNILKHSGATRITISILNKQNRLTILIEDNGKGFDIDQNPEMYAKGLGLRGMNERAAILDGSIKLESTPGKGTKLLLEIPFENE